MKRFHPGVLLLGIAGAWPLMLQAVQVGKENLPDQWTLDGQTLQVNGAGSRDYGFLRIRVYVAALYLAAPESAPTAILASPAPKVMHVRFLRDVSLQDTLQAWDYYFEQNCRAPCTLPQNDIAAFKALLPQSIAGETQTYLFRADSLELLRNGTSIGVIRGAQLPKLLLSTWIGEAPATESLKKALLGKTKVSAAR